MEIYQAVENSIIKKYRRGIWRPFIKALQTYELIQNGDRIAVCISGGKDSTLLAKCMQELKRYSLTAFDVVYLTMDPGYNTENRTAVERNAELLRIPVSIFETDIFDTVAKVGEGACYLCARMRRGHLYKKARELGCNKIALAHHYDDVIETTLLSMFYGGEFKTMMPKLRSKNFEGMELIRPLYLTREDAIIAWRNYHKLEFIRCGCRFTEYCAPDDGGGSKRQEIKRLLKELRKLNPIIEKNIFKSAENVNTDAVIGYKRHGEKRIFLEEY
ncbi:MAG: tRNA 2-thiocytidine biosynthesis protein TtcA [Clostridiales bacterium]|nr:tRNA 2-thiocytidine biosynthesis protein TtcA [Clostridiales bacterium]